MFALSIRKLWLPAMAGLVLATAACSSSSDDFTPGPPRPFNETVLESPVRQDPCRSLNGDVSRDSSDTFGLFVVDGSSDCYDGQQALDMLQAEKVNTAKATADLKRAADKTAALWKKEAPKELLKSQEGRTVASVTFFCKHSDMYFARDVALAEGRLTFDQMSELVKSFCVDSWKKFRNPPTMMVAPNGFNTTPAPRRTVPPPPPNDVHPTPPPLAN